MRGSACERISRLAIFSVALALAGCLFVCSQASAGNAATPSPTHLLSYVAEENVPDSGVRYHWKFWDPDTGKQQTFLDLTDKPKLVVWDTQERLVYYAIGSRIFDTTYPRTHALPAQVADLPPGEVIVMWPERTTGRLRVIVREAIPDSAIIRKPHGKVAFRLADGSTVSGTDLPDWGVAAVLTALELGPRGQWARLARRATKDGAGDTPGTDVVNEFRHERGASEDAIADSFVCGEPETETCGETLPKSLWPPLRAAGNYAAADFAYLAPANGLMGLTFNTAMGDTMHTLKPLFLVPPDGDKLVPIKLHTMQEVHIGRNGKYLLIDDGDYGDNPIVIDLKTGRTVFSADGCDAVWVP